jgi:poly(3-hydroxybutyrate) depolymerase
MQYPVNIGFYTRLVSLLIVFSLSACGGAASSTYSSSALDEAYGTCNTFPTQDHEIRYPYLSDEAETPLIDAWNAGVQSGDEQESYLLYVPSDLPHGPVPLVVVVHGITANALNFSRKTQLAATAEERKFILAFPNGRRSWETSEGSSDVGYVRDIISDVKSSYCIDERRVWGAGHSMGAMLMHRLACEAGDVFAAMTPTAGSPQSPCDGGTGAEQHPAYMPIPIATWHGDNDDVVAYSSGRASLAAWVARYQCDEEPIDVDESSVYGPVETFGNCKRADVVAREQAAGTPFVLKFTTFNGHSHQYPDGCGGQSDANNCLPFMPTTAEMNSQLLNYLEAYPRPLSSISN